MNHEELKQLLVDNGFINGWALHGETLVLWFHKDEPPAPLEIPDETPSAD